MKKISERVQKIAYDVMNLSNSELRALRVMVEREITLSELCIEEGTEKRK